MHALLHIPAPLRQYCAGAYSLSVPAGSIRAALEQLERDHPVLLRCIRDESGAIRRHVNLFVNRSHIRDLQGLDTPLEPGDEVVILPAVSGG
jgi:molybdopterin converting factor small subunit